jgi:uncharacterized protein YqgV (UPF0045/DUF77 family)
MILAAQVSVYPLRQLNLSPAITQVLNVFHSYGLEVSQGPMSSIVLGEDETLFTAPGKPSPAPPSQAQRQKTGKVSGEPLLSDGMPLIFSTVLPGNDSGFCLFSV